MRIDVLGSGSSGNCYIITAKILDGRMSRLILDAGVKYDNIMRAIDWNTKDVSCLVTHSHRDHSESAGKLARRGIDVYSCEEVANNTTGVWHLPAMKKERLENWMDVVPFNVPHGETECYGYVIYTHEPRKVILYATDYEYIPYNFRDIGITHMIIECNYSDREALKEMAKYEHVARGHAALETAYGVVEANMTDSLEFVLLCHVSATEDAEAMRDRVQKLVGDNVTVVVAKKGEKYGC